jgi:hypothetical protein
MSKAGQHAPANLTPFPTSLYDEAGVYGFRRPSQ